MPVVKAQAPHLTRQSAIVMNMSDLEHQATQGIIQARQQAEQIIAAARIEAERLGQELRAAAQQAGHEEGYAAGFKEGQTQGHDEAVAQTKEGLEGLIARWSNTLDNFQNNLPTHLADVRVDLVQLSLAIAAKVTHLEALRNTQVVSANVTDALALVTAGRSVVIQVHPDEVAVLENYLPDLISKFRSIVSVDLKPDANITPGGCVLTFGSGQIDAQLETQVQRIADELIGENT